MALPYVTENKVVKIAKDIVKEEVPEELPEVTAEDKNKYLHTNEDTGALEWSGVSGGGTQLYSHKLALSATPPYSCIVVSKTQSAYTDVLSIINDLEAGNVISILTGERNGYFYSACYPSASHGYAIKQINLYSDTISITEYTTFLSDTVTAL